MSVTCWRAPALTRFACIFCIGLGKHHKFMIIQPASFVLKIDCGEPYKDLINLGIPTPGFSTDPT